jgi:hypothetical protein
MQVISYKNILEIPTYRCNESQCKRFHIILKHSCKAFSSIMTAECSYNTITKQYYEHITGVSDKGNDTEAQ